MRMRDARRDDADFLREMSLRAMLWRGTGDATTIPPELEIYLREWGRPGDTGVIAEAELEDRIGATWYRTYSASEPGYGFVAEDVPEVGIAVLDAHQGQGVGRGLMAELAGRARAMDLRGLSLSVEDGNHRAAGLYAASGFSRVARNGDAWTMVLWLR